MWSPYIRQLIVYLLACPLDWTPTFILDSTALEFCFYVRPLDWTPTFKFDNRELEWGAECQIIFWMRVRHSGPFR